MVEFCRDGCKYNKEDFDNMSCELSPPCCAHDLSCQAVIQ